jgi:hypothetical protein
MMPEEKKTADGHGIRQPVIVSGRMRTEKWLRVVLLTSIETLNDADVDMTSWSSNRSERRMELVHVVKYDVNRIQL